jgi:hypothetical protein
MLVMVYAAVPTVLFVQVLSVAIALTVSEAATVMGTE